MRFLFLGPDLIGCEAKRLAEAKGWNLSSTDDVVVANDLLREIEFQAVLVYADQGALPCAEISALRRMLRSPVVACLSEDNPQRRSRVLKLGALTTVRYPFFDGEFYAALTNLIVHKIEIQRTHIHTVRQFGCLQLDLASQEVTGNAGTVFLPRKPFQLLDLLTASANRPVSRERILTRLYGLEDEPEPKVIDVMICKLRRTLAKIDVDDVSILTDRGFGYRISCAHHQAQKELAA